MKLFLYSPIGGFETEDVLNQLKTPPKDESLELHINSPGGDVFSGFAIYNRLKTIPNNIIVNIDGLAGSMASVIAMAGDEINISEAGSIMIHNAVAMLGGNAKDLEKQIDQLKAIDKVIAKIYSGRTRQKQSAIKQLMDAETVMMADQAIKLGFADKIAKPIKAVAQINLNDMTIKDKIKGLASIVFGENLETDELKELKTDLEAKTETEIEAKVQEKEGSEALFSEYVPTSEFLEFKNQVVEFIGQVVSYIEEQPEKEDIFAQIKSNTNEELYKLLTEVKSKNKVPTAKEYQNNIATDDGGFDLEKAKEYAKKNKNN